MAKKSEKNDIIVTLKGSSAVGVTGSCTEVDIPFIDTKLLFEIGLCQEYSPLENYNANYRIVNSIDVEKTKYIFIGHNHIDHCGLLCALVNRGWKGTIFCTYEVSKIMKHMLEDVVYLHDKECKMLSKNNRKNTVYLPFMEEKDIDKTMNLIEVVDYDRTYELEKGIIKFKLLKNNHIVGSCSIELWVRKPNNSVKKIYYTSDLGSTICKNYYVSNLEISHTNNLTIIESTYGNKTGYTKQDRKNEVKILSDAIKETVLDKKGNILIPVFSLSRLQFMLTLVYEILKDKDEYREIPVVVDTRLGVSINREYKEILQNEDLELFKEVMGWEQLKQITNYQDTVACCNDDTPKIVLSASGFLASGTHATIYLKKWLGGKNNCVVFCGYCGGNTSLGGRIQDTTTKTIRIDDGICKKNCKVISLKTFSSHIQQSELISMVKQINTEKIILHHGSEDARNVLKERMVEELRNCGKTTSVVVSHKDMQVIL
jgi:metallo-beta-lactamase family protein